MTRYTNDELEDLGLIEICLHCSSIDIKSEKELPLCDSCGAVGYTKYLNEKEAIEVFQTKHNGKMV